MQHSGRVEWGCFSVRASTLRVSQQQTSEEQILQSNLGNYMEGVSLDLINIYQSFFGSHSETFWNQDVVG